MTVAGRCTLHEFNGRLRGSPENSSGPCVGSCLDVGKRNKVHRVRCAGVAFFDCFFDCINHGLDVRQWQLFAVQIVLGVCEVPCLAVDFDADVVHLGFDCLGYLGHANNVNTGFAR